MEGMEEELEEPLTESRSKKLQQNTPLRHLRVDKTDPWAKNKIWTISN